MIHFCFANIFTLFANFLHFLANTPLNFAIFPPFLATIALYPIPQRIPTYTLPNTQYPIFE